MNRRSFLRMAGLAPMAACAAAVVPQAEASIIPAGARLADHPIVSAKVYVGERGPEFVMTQERAKRVAQRNIAANGTYWKEGDRGAGGWVLRSRVDPETGLEIGFGP